MTSEPSQHGWQPADRYEPTDEAPNQRGFGLFDAPAAPDEFPVFTPYSGSAREGDAQFPPDSEMASSAPSFAGFPSDDIAPAASEWASSVSDHYVPAPAVVPIPGVRHDPELSLPELEHLQRLRQDPYPVPAAELDREEPSGGASSWAAFAAGDSPKAPNSSAGGAWSEPSAPSWEDHPLNEQRREEPSRHEPAWGDSSYGTAEPEIAQPVSPAVGSARVSAAAPIQHRPEPTPEIPPISAPRPAGRVYGSAAVAAPHTATPSPTPRLMRRPRRPSAACRRPPCPGCSADSRRAAGPGIGSRNGERGQAQPGRGTAAPDHSVRQRFTAPRPSGPPQARCRQRLPRRCLPRRCLPPRWALHRS